MTETVASLVRPVVNKINSIQARRLTPFVHCSKINSLLSSLREIPAILSQAPADAPITVAFEQAAHDLFQTVQDIDELITQCCSDNYFKVLLSASVRAPKRIIFELRVGVVRLMGELGFNASSLTMSEEEMDREDVVDVKRIAQLLLKASKTRDVSDVQELMRARLASLEALGNTISEVDVENVMLPELPHRLDLVFRHDEIELCQQTIGTGQTGKVMLGKIRATGQAVAVKAMTRKSLSQADFDAFQREIYTLSVLQHPNLLKFYGYTKEAPFCILTEYVAKGSLYDVLRDPTQRLNGTEKTIIACDVADGLLYLHEHGIIHRDMKSLNVLLTEDNRAKICDFGLARTRSKGPMTGLVGTAHWMAPEVLLSRPTYDEKVDVYGFGVILWELLTGDIPYRDMPTAKVAILVIEQDMRPPLPQNGPTHLMSLIQSCWEKDPSKRPAMKFVATQLRKKKLHFPGTDESVFEHAKRSGRAKRLNSMSVVKSASLSGLDADALVAMAELADENAGEYIRDLLNLLPDKKQAEEAADAGGCRIIEKVLLEQTSRSIYAMEKLMECPSPQIFDVPVLKALLLYSGCRDTCKREHALNVLLNGCELRFDFICASESFLPALLVFFRVHVSEELSEKILSLVFKLVGALDSLPANAVSLLMDMMSTQPENVKSIVACLVSALRFDSAKALITTQQWLAIMERFKECSPIMVQYCDPTTSFPGDSTVVNLLFQYKEYDFISTIAANTRFINLIVEHLPIGGEPGEIVMVYRSVLVNNPDVVFQLEKEKEFYDVAAYLISSGNFELICSALRRCNVDPATVRETSLCRTLAEAIVKEKRPERLVTLMAPCFSLLRVSDFQEFMPLQPLFESIFNETKMLRMPTFLCLSQLARYSPDMKFGELVAAAAMFLTADSTLMRQISAEVIMAHLADPGVNPGFALRVFTENVNESRIDENVRKTIVVMEKFIQHNGDLVIEPDVREKVAKLYEHVCVN